MFIYSPEIILSNIKTILQLFKRQFEYYYFMEILYAFLLGLILGSFLNSLSYRIPIILNYQNALKDFPDLGLSFPRSFCPNCKAPLSAFSLIPVLSYFIQLGKCKSCKKNISISYPFFEILMGILFALMESYVSGSKACHPRESLRLQRPSFKNPHFRGYLYPLEI